MRCLPVLLLFAGCPTSSDDDDGGPSDGAGPDGGGPNDDDDDGTPGTDPDTNTMYTGGTTDGPCGFTVCGGDVTGSWNFTHMCGASPIPITSEDCPTARIWFEGEMTGTWTFDAGGTFDVNASVDMSVFATTPVECLDVADCSELESLEYPELECTGDVTVACTCTRPLDLVLPVIDSGRWSKDGNGIIVENRGDGLAIGGATLHFAICEQGDRLDLDQRDGLMTRYVLTR